MTSIERTAYPRFKRLITARELHLFFSPSREEVEWAVARTDSDGHQLALLVLLKSYQRMGCFPRWEEVPETVVDFVQRAVELPEGVVAGYGAEKTAKNHRALVRQRVGVLYDAGRARKVAEEAIRAEAASKNNPADLINVALEQLVQRGLELPAFSTLDRMAMRIRTEVNTDIFALVHRRIGAEERAGLLRLVTTLGLDRKTLFNQLKQPAKRAIWSHLKKLADHRRWLDELGDTEVWLEDLAVDAAAFRTQLQERLTEAAVAADSGYPDNEGLFIDPKTGVPTLEKYRADERRPSAVKLEQAIKARLPERSSLGVLARTAYWVEWWRRFGPASGHDPKLKDAFGRYVITTFVNGTNLGPYEAARHINGVSGHELSATANRHFSIAKLNQAITDVVNAHAQLDMARAWGDGTAVAADGSHMDTYLNNLVAETSVRYGRPGGIAYHHVADTYIALFTHFIPCGVWEAVYIIEGLLKNESEIQPTTIHADTQGQSYPVFSLAHLLGFELMPRIRNWKDLVFFRPTRQTSYVHIDALFGEAGRNVIDWDLIEQHFKDLMRVALSVREGKVSSVLLLRRLRSGSRKNAHYAAFREVGRVIRTVQLLRYLTDPRMRRRVTAATNKVEAFNGFSEWVRFGNRGVIADNDPVEQEKAVKFNALLTNCLIFHNTLDIAQAVRELQAEGWNVDPEDLAEVSPYLTEKIMRFGEYSTHELDLAPEAYEPHLDVDFTKLDPQEFVAAS
ncbi:Tn3 family transposase [Kitasatospora sp. NPDC087314]|uniref:Tn3 family transposase n=1 Tax=Kitasatospora sp. NPDC087314 TaxID=3364068 RepID=UPI00380EFA9E